MAPVIDISKLEILVKSLSDSLDWAGTKLAIATAVVVIGLVVECWDDFADLARAVVGCFRHRSLDRLRYLDHKIKLAVVGGLMITVGVGAELWFEYRASNLEGQLQSANGQIVAFLNGKASDADERAKGFESQIAGATAREKAAEAQIASANAGAREAKISSLESKLELAELKAPRVIKLSPSLRDKLAQFKGTPFDLAIARDADSNSLAGSVFTILTLQGWVRQAIAPGEIELFGHRGIFFAAFPSAGVRITAGSSGQLGACSVLFEMFTDSEISSMGLPGNDTATPIERQLPIQIMIGEKPKQSFKQVMQEALKACSMNEACRKANPAIMRSMPQ